MTENRTLARRIVVGVYIACFSIGAFNHARDFLAFGFRPYNYSWAPLWLEAFWSALLLLDIAIVVLLLIGSLRSALALAAVVMICDVAANSYASLGPGIDGFVVALPLQATFLGFVLGSISFLWPKA